jgi:hypothetical protein
MEDTIRRLSQLHPVPYLVLADSMDELNTYGEESYRSKESTALVAIDTVGQWLAR